MQKIDIEIAKHATTTKSVLMGMYRIVGADYIGELNRIAKNTPFEYLNDEKIPVTIKVVGIAQYVEPTTYTNKKGELKTRSERAKYDFNFKITISKSDADAYGLDKADKEHVIENVKSTLQIVLSDVMRDNVGFDDRVVKATELFGGIEYQQNKKAIKDYMIANETDSIGTSNVPLLN